MTLEELKALKDTGEFHHATYRDHGTCWEGLWVYRKKADGFRGFDVVGCFAKDDPNLDAASDLVRGTGVSVGAYGCG